MSSVGLFPPSAYTLAYLTPADVLKIDVATGQRAGTIGAHNQDVRNVVAFTADGKRLLRGQLYSIEVWNVAP